MEEPFTLPPDPTPGYGSERSLRLIRDWLTDARSVGRMCRNTPQFALATLRLLDAVYEASAAGGVLRGVTDEHSQRIKYFSSVSASGLLKRRQGWVCPQVDAFGAAASERTSQLC